MSSDSEQPREKVHGKDCHSDTEDDSGKSSFCSAFTKCERESADHEGNECKPLRDGSSERLLKYIYRVFPRRIALRSGRAGHCKNCSEGNRPPLDCPKEM
jgi:hypothetical protein